VQSTRFLDFLQERGNNDEQFIISATLMLKNHTELKKIHDKKNNLLLRFRFI